MHQVPRSYCDRLWSKSEQKRPGSDVITENMICVSADRKRAGVCNVRMVYITVYYSILPNTYPSFDNYSIL